ncbi:MAG: hypothetical protein J5608_01745 [Alphaproteobacteria bacterium]|nr:hypothetical protein [Alphaproteobacteria bacterium]
MEKTKKSKKEIKKEREEKYQAQHWVKSQAKLMKILEAAGMAPKKQTVLLPHSNDR